MKKELCPVIETAKLVGKRWSLILIYNLMDGPKRFNELLRVTEGISSKSLSQNLSGLVEEKLVKRKVYSSSPIRVEYSLTEKGRDLKGLIEAMRIWGERWLI